MKEFFSLKVTAVLETFLGIFFQDFPWVCIKKILSWLRNWIISVFAKTAGLSDKTGKFSFCPEKISVRLTNVL